MCSGRAGAGSGFSFGKPGSGRVPGSEGCEPEVSKVSVFDEFRGDRFCSRSLDGFGSGNRVPETRIIKKVSGSGDSVPKVPQVFCTSKVYHCTRKFTHTLVLCKYTFVL